MVTRAESGTTLFIVLVFMSVLLVGLLVAMPVLQTQVWREREEELIFRGGQYVEAVRLFVLKNPGRFPESVEELVEGRFLRKAFPDPMTKDGAWNIILLGGPAGGMAPAPAPAGAKPPEGQASSRFSAQTLFVVPEKGLGSVDNPRIIGVVSSSTRKSFKILDDEEAYDAWLFYYGRTPGTKPEIIRVGMPTK